jgi:CRP/FNR family cyclic AMP-dependent transcriptional regulator
MSDVTAQNVPELAGLLATTPLFEGLDERYLERMAAIGSEERYKRGEYIFRHGEVGEKFFLILEGAVRISRQVPGMGEEALAVFRAGSAFGEMALIDDSPRSADALAHEGCRLFVVTKRDLEDLLFVDWDLAHDFLWKMVRLLAARLRETTDKMAFLSFAGKFE